MACKANILMSALRVCSSRKEILEEVDRKHQRRKHVLLSLLPRLADAGLFLRTDLDLDS